jgi:hypothetical protein
MKVVLLLTLLFTIVIVSQSDGQSTLALQEKCAEGAKKLAEGMSNVEQYRNHYNKRLDKCLIRIVFHYKDLDKKNYVEYMVQVVDVFETTVFGSLIYSDKWETRCMVGNIICNSMDEFEALIKPYMEE